MIKPRFFIPGLVLTAILTQIAATPALAAANITTLHEFSASSGPAMPVYGHLLDNGAGEFYGMTQAGGNFGQGTVFRVTSDGTVTTRANFKGSGEEPLGAGPLGSLIRASDGYFYGTTRDGGANGVGTVFKMDSTGLVTTIVEFINDGSTMAGANPEGNLVVGNNGFYGMTRHGGVAEMGTIFHLTPGGVLTNLVEFDNNVVAGAFPRGSLLLATDGNFYGMTSGGGNNGNGTVFKLTPAGVLTTLVRFNAAAAPKGAHPYGSLLPGVGNTFYGMTADGGKGHGTIFQVTTAGAVTTLVEFGDNAAPLGAHPFGSLIPGTDGQLYGVTSAGGVAGKGTVFRMTAAGVLTTLTEFDNLSVLGSTPSGSLMQAADGFYYGMTTAGGADDAGTIFKLDASLPPPAPEIGVQQPAGVNLTDGVSSVAFGTVGINTTSELTFVITNSGTASLLDLTITFDGANSNLFVLSTPATAPVAARSETIFSVQFTPTNGGNKTATLHIANNDADEAPFDITLTGSGQEPGAALAFDGSNDGVLLGNLPELAFERTNPFTIELWYKSSSTAIQALFSKLNPGGQFNGYEVFLENGAINVYLINNFGANYIWVRTASAPVAGLWHHAAVSYDGSSSAGGVKIYVDGVAQTLQVVSDTLTGSILNSTSVNLGIRANGAYGFNGTMDEVRVWNRVLDQCEIQAQRNVELTGNERGLVDYFQFNQGSAAVNNAGVTTLANTVPGGATGTLNNFALSGATGNWVAPGGVVPGTLLPTPYVAPEIAVLGGTPQIAIAKGDTTPGTADGTDFGSLAAGATPLVRTFSITNSGTSLLVVSAIAKSGPNAGEFSIGSPGLPIQLDPGVATNFTIAFAPTASGLRTATITITSTDCDEASYDFAVSGSGVAPEISIHQPFGTEILDGASRSLGSVRVGEVTNVTFTITNSGNANLTGLAITIDGTDAAMFTVTASPTAPVAGNASTTFIVQFAPTTTGAKNASLHVANNDGDENPYDIGLSGNGLTPVPEIDILGLNNSIAKGDTTPSVSDNTDFGNAALTGLNGAVSHAFTISNSGTAPLNISAINITGASSGDFGVSGIAPPAAVPAKSSTTFTITFIPTVVGLRTATVTVVNNDSDEGNYDFAVQGTGVSLTPSLSIMRSGANVVVSWPLAGATGFLLEQTTTAAKTNSWTTSGANITNDGQSNSATISITTSNFFRLRKL